MSLLLSDSFRSPSSVVTTTTTKKISPPRQPRFIYLKALAVSIIFFLSFIQPTSGYVNVTIGIPDDICSEYKTCDQCTENLACGFCVLDNKCVPGGWNQPFGKAGPLCTNDKWEYNYAQCLVTHKQILISLSSALVSIVFLSVFLCMCCCLCRCCRFGDRGTDEERSPLLGGDSLATHHFRRASFYNYNRNRPFERRRTLSSSTANSSMQYGRNLRNSDDYVYGYGGPSVLWANEHNPPAAAIDFSIGSQGNGTGAGTTDWKRWEKKREELLAQYGKNNEG